MVCDSFLQTRLLVSTPPLKPTRAQEGDIYSIISVFKFFGTKFIFSSSHMILFFSPCLSGFSSLRFILSVEAKAVIATESNNGNITNMLQQHPSPLCLQKKRTKINPKTRSVLPQRLTVVTSRSMLRSHVGVVQVQHNFPSLCRA